MTNRKNTNDKVGIVIVFHRDGLSSYRFHIYMTKYQIKKFLMKIMY